MDAELRRSITTFLQNYVDKCRVMVVGDIMLDRYFYGNVTRISPEAPVPVNLIGDKKNVLGGAGNVAHNLARLGCKVYLAGLFADDHHGHLLMTKIQKKGIDVEGVLIGRKNTTTKVRVLGGHQQMIRLDFEETEPPAQSKIQEMLNYITKRLKSGLDAIILSDYGKGVCTENLCQQIIYEAHRNNIPVFVDPKGNDWAKYAGVDYITPNVKEVGVIIGKNLPNDDELLRRSAKVIAEKYNTKSIMITRSEKGISLFQADREIHAPTVAQEVFDVSGAGDTVIAVFAAGIAGNLNVEDAIKLANIAAGVEVSKLGTYAVSKSEILSQCL